MTASSILENSVFLRPLNYLRVKSEYALAYNWIYPTIIAIVLFLCCEYSPAPQKFEIFEKTFEEISSLLTVLLPFYIASLAAVSTFTGGKFLDEKFDGRVPLSLRIRVSRNEWDTKILTPRNLLRLIFAYCTLATLFLIILLFVYPLVVFFASSLADKLEFILLAAFRLIAFFITSQLCLATVIAVYFLSDYLVRNENN